MSRELPLLPLWVPRIINMIHPDVEGVKAFAGMWVPINLEAENWDIKQ